MRRLFGKGSTSSAAYSLRETTAGIVILSEIDGLKIQFSTAVPGGFSDYKLVFNEDDLQELIHAGIQSRVMCRTEKKITDFSTAELIEEIQNRTKE